MKKILFIIVIIVSAIVPAFSDDANGFRFDGGIGLTGSIYSRFLTVNPEIMYDFGLIALGGGVNNLFGLTFCDIYTIPYAEIELAWFYLAGGVIFELKEAVDDPEKAPDGFMRPDNDSGLNPYVVIGANFPMLQVGPGKLGTDIFFGIVPTATPVQVVKDSENFLSDVIGTIILSLFSAGFNLFKLGGTIYYTATF